MAFSEKTKTLTSTLIQAELENIIKQYGDKYNSLHEGYAILKEELEEAVIELKAFNTCFNMYWVAIKDNDKVETEKNIKYMIYYHEKMIKELAQVGAVLQKIKNTAEAYND